MIIRVQQHLVAGLIFGSPNRWLTIMVSREIMHPRKMSSPFFPARISTHYGPPLKNGACTRPVPDAICVHAFGGAATASPPHPEGGSGAVCRSLPPFCKALTGRKHRPHIKHWQLLIKVPCSPAGGIWINVFAFFPVRFFSVFYQFILRSNCNSTNLMQINWVLLGCVLLLCNINKTNIIEHWKFHI